MTNPSFVMTGGRLIIAAIGILTTPVLTRLLSVHEYATFSLALAIVAFASTVPSQWATASILRFGPSAEIGDLNKSLWRALAWTALPVVVLAGTLSVITFGAEPRLLLIVALYALAELAFLALWVASRAKIRAKTYVTAGIVRNAVSLLIVGALWSLEVPITALVAVSAAGVASATAASALILLLRSEPSRAPTEIALSTWWSYGATLILNYGLGMIILQMGKFLLYWLDSPRAVAEFSPTFDLMLAITSLTVGLVGLTTVPRIFSAPDNASAGHLVRRLKLRVSVAIIAVSIGMVTAWPALSRLLIGSEMRSSSLPLILTTAATFAIMSYRTQYQNIIAQLAKENSRITWSTAIGMMVTLVASLLLIPMLGATGASTAAMLGAASSVLGMSILSNIARSSE